jgi:hypothetical protein
MVHYYIILPLKVILIDSFLAIWPLIKNGDMAVSKLEWEGLTATIKRDSIEQAFNFDFLLKLNQQTLTA